MKRFSVLAITIMVFGILSCGWSGWDNTIHNQSSFDVTFSLRKTSSYKVLSGKTFIGARNDLGVAIDKYESCTPNRVAFVEINLREGKFIDLPSIPVQIYNTLSFPVTLTADGFLEIEPMSVAIGDANTNTIFTKNPILTITSNSFPATADFQIVDGVMYIIVR